MKRRVLTFSLLLLGLGLGLGTRRCGDESPASEARAIEREYIGPERSLATAMGEEERERRECEERLREVLEAPAAPGAPQFEARRGELLARAKAEPVLFVETPEYDKHEQTLSVEGYRGLLKKASAPWATVQRLLTEFKGRPQPARAALLRDGYLYADDPEVAYALVSLVKPQHLFGHDRIWIQRGDQTHFAERRGDRYHYVDGPLEGQPLRLLHLDRVGHDAPPARALHRDLRSLMYRLDFEQMSVRHVTHDAIVANLRYGRLWVPTVLSTRGARVDFECEVLTPKLRDEVEQAKRETKRRQRAVQGLRLAMLAQVDEGLPFDEPHHEYGHQFDGKLRSNWHWAYLTRRSSYAFNGDLYFVYDAKGRPLVPQVCIDFLTDTFERMSGTWWNGRGSLPKRVIGKLDFNKLLDEGQRDALRQVPAFLDFARKNGEWFETYDAPPEHTWVRMGRADRFYRYLEEHADDFQPGDIVVIRGKTPWDARYLHYHSFFVYERDPVTGMPLIVVGNAGKPSLRSWETEARRTPRRSIHHRVRPRVEWLEGLMMAQSPPSEPLTLVTARE